MNKSGIGIGSASIVLVFVVLCLTIFALISLSYAEGEKAMTDTEAAMIKGYYEADTLAERVLAEILEADATPEAVQGIDVTAKWERDMLAEIAEFSCPVPGFEDQKELYVRVAIYEDSSYDILEWRMRDVGEWEIDDGLPVWQG